MTVYYLDSSAWVKRYLSEPGSAWVRRLFDRKEPLACCPLGCTEVAAAIARQQGVQKISADRLRILRRDVLADWSEMLQVPLDPTVFQTATEFAWDLKLHGADALHWRRLIRFRSRWHPARFPSLWLAPIWNFWRLPGGVRLPF